MAPRPILSRSAPSGAVHGRRVGMLFLPNDEAAAAAAVAILEKVVAAEGRCRIAGWRDVPVDHAVVGRMAKATQPIIRQVRRRHYP